MTHLENLTEIITPRQRQLSGQNARQLQIWLIKYEDTLDISKWRSDEVWRMEKDARKYLKEATTLPLQTAIRAGCDLLYMDKFDLWPESFTDKTDRETADLLEYRLNGAFKTSRQLLSAEEMETCDRCIRAIYLQEFYLNMYQTLDIRESYLDSKNEYKYGVIHNILMSIVFVCITGCHPLMTFLDHELTGSAISRQFHYDSPGFFIYIELVMVAIAIFVVRRYWRRDLIGLRADIDQIAQVGGFKTQGFWEQISAEFGGIPTRQQLEQLFFEQKPFVDAVYPGDGE